MDANETARLVAIVRSTWPAQRFDEDARNTINAWGMVLGDLHFAECFDAVRALARRGIEWCQPGAVRREVARKRNALAPSADALLRDVLDVASEQGRGRKLLHPIARDVYDANGGAVNIVRMTGAAQHALRRALADAAQKHDERVLEDEMPPPRGEHEPVLTLLADPLRIRRALGVSDDETPELEAHVTTEKTPTPMPEYVREQWSKIARGVDE